MPGWLFSFRSGSLAADFTSAAVEFARPFIDLWHRIASSSSVKSSNMSLRSSDFDSLLKHEVYCKGAYSHRYIFAYIGSLTYKSILTQTVASKTACKLVVAQLTILERALRVRFLGLFNLKDLNLRLYRDHKWRGAHSNGRAAMKVLTRSIKNVNI